MANPNVNKKMTRKTESIAMAAHHSQQIEGQENHKEENPEMKEYLAGSKIAYTNISKLAINADVNIGKKVAEEAKKMDNMIKELVAKYLQKTDYSQIEEMIKNGLTEIQEENTRTRAMCTDMVHNAMDHVQELQKNNGQIERSQQEIKLEIEQCKEEIKRNQEEKNKVDKEVQEKIEKLTKEQKKTINMIKEKESGSSGINEIQHKELTEICKENKIMNQELKENIEKIRKVSEEIRQDNKIGKEVINSIKETQEEKVRIVQQKETEGERTETYAEKLNNKGQRRPHTTYHSIIVNSVD
ncbi:unnamed protein product [Diatraea saccharalis]|uniref:Uncharacterized protein n=1 Tax=Diatraea saccharalis TaxID=40085 RepID=A0A9N9N412_9NEOP|nr:unnamed protein product [Diatraea saccharalis]